MVLAVAVVSATALLEATSCVDIRGAVSHFELNRCPSGDFFLPDSVYDPPYGFTPGSRMASSLPNRCPLFRLYHAVGPDFRWGVGRVDVRLNRGTTCSLDVVNPYYYGKPRGDVPTFDDARRAGEIVARIMMHGSDAEPRFPAARIEQLNSYKDAKRFCARPFASDLVSLVPASGMARLVVLCPDLSHQPDSTALPQILIDSAVIGRAEGGTYLAMDVPAGVHRISSARGGEIVLNASPGSTYFVKVWWKHLTWKPQTGMKSVDSAEGQVAIASARRRPTGAANIP